MDKATSRSRAPASQAMKGLDPPDLVALNLTRRCNLRCAHCYLDAGTRARGAPDELSTAEIKRLLDGIAELGRETMVVLTGGEPLLRADLFELARHASTLGLLVVVGTNGTLLDEARAARLKRAGVKAAGISLDSLDPGYHDRFRGKPGAWTRTMAGIDTSRRAGLLLQIHFSVTDDNAHELPDMIAFARDAGAVVLNVFFLVCTGRGETVTNVSRAVYERILGELAEAARREQGLILRARCAPHFKRIALEIEPALPVTLVHGYEAGGCLAGTRYCRVTPEGEVTPCPYMELSVGSVVTEDFATLWRDAPLFRRLREPSLKGRCGACEYAKLCGGCRARPLARFGDIMGEDFLCRYQPSGGAVIEAAARTDGDLAWTSEAEMRLSHIPTFIRRFVRRRAEAHARDAGMDLVTVELLHQLARRRFSVATPRRVGPTRSAAPESGKELLR